MTPASIAASVPPARSMASSRSRAPRSISSVSASTAYEPADRIDGVRHAALVRDDLLRAQRDARRFLGRQRQRLVAAVAVQRLRAAEHRRQRLQRHPHDVVVRLLRGERAAGGLRVEAQLLRPRVGRRRTDRASAAPTAAAPRGTWRSPRENRCGRRRRTTAAGRAASTSRPAACAAST